MPKLDERIGHLEARLKQLKAQQIRVAARQRALESRRSRKNETRRKILVGAVLLERVQRGLFDKAVLDAWLDVALSRAEDRELFDLSVGEGAVSGRETTTG
jgi:hypothetical protein